MEQTSALFKVKTKKGLYYLELWTPIGDSGGRRLLMTSEGYSTMSAAYASVSEVKKYVNSEIDEGVEIKKEYPCFLITEDKYGKFLFHFYPVEGICLFNSEFRYESSAAVTNAINSIQSKAREANIYYI